MKVSWLLVGLLAFQVLPFTACRIQQRRPRERRATNNDACQSRPCQHNGACSDTIDGFTCTCADGYSGKFCEKSNRASLSNKEAIILFAFVTIFVAIIYLAIFIWRLQILNLCNLGRRRFQSSPTDESSECQTGVLEDEGARKTGQRVGHDDPEHSGKSSRNQELSTLPGKGLAGQNTPQTKNHYQEIKSLVPAEPKYGTLSPETREPGKISGEGLKEQNSSQSNNPYQEIKSLVPAEPKYGTLSPETRDPGSTSVQNTSQSNKPYQEIITLAPAEPKYGSLSPETRESGNASGSVH